MKTDGQPPAHTVTKKPFGVAQNGYPAGGGGNKIRSMTRGINGNIVVPADGRSLLETERFTRRAITAGTGQYCAQITSILSR